MKPELLKISAGYDMILTVFIVVLCAAVAFAGAHVGGGLAAGSAAACVSGAAFQCAYLILIQRIIYADISDITAPVWINPACHTLQILAIIATITGLTLYIASV